VSVYKDDAEALGAIRLRNVETGFEYNEQRAALNRAIERAAKWDRIVAVLRDESLVYADEVVAAVKAIVLGDETGGGA
jgi:hypothetical protein